jgi:hypothetical protein
MGHRVSDPDLQTDLVRDTGTEHRFADPDLQTYLLRDTDRTDPDVNARGHS